MAEESQPPKRHKPSNTHIEHGISQVSPIRDDLDSQNPIPIGEEENTREAEDKAQLDDKLQFITGSLPKFEHQHALVSSQLFSDIERIENPKDEKPSIPIPQSRS